LGSKKRILVVDDEVENRSVLSELLEALGYEYETANDGVEALAKLQLDFDMILCDVMMPGMDGFEVVNRVRKNKKYGDIPIMMVTGLTGKEDRLRAVKAGANDFIGKPIDMAELQIRAASLIRMKESQDALKRHKKDLESKILEKTEALRNALSEMVEAQRKSYQAHLDTMRRLAIAAEYKDEGTAEHILRMSYYSAILAKGMGLSPGEVELIKNTSPMHDVGKIGIPDGVLLKPGQLDEKEWEVMKQHTVIGSRILSGSTSELLQMGEIIAMSHHEKWDGSGYPEGLEGEAIPLYGRIVTVADVFDALTTVRPYKKRLTNEDAYEIIKNGSGTHFDPKVVEVFFASVKEIEKIQKKHKDSPQPEQPSFDFEQFRY